MPKNPPIYAKFPKPGDPKFPKSSTLRLISCPLGMDLQSFRFHERGLLQAMRRLRRDLNRCRVCARRGNCSVMNEFNSVVTEAIQEITDEFNHD